jgi:hypothetical protein
MPADAQYDRLMDKLEECAVLRQTLFDQPASPKRDAALAMLDKAERMVQDALRCNEPAQRS